MTDSVGRTHQVTNAAPVPPLAAPSVELEFEHVYQAHFDFVWKSLRRLGVSQDCIDDAAQDVFVVVHQKLEAFEGRSSLKTWLFGIAHLVALGYHRRRHASASPAAPEALPSLASGPLEHAEARETLRFVESVLDSLGDAKRPVFVLAEFEQMSAPQIAEALGIKLNTVYSRLRAARTEFQAAVTRRRKGRE